MPVDSDFNGFVELNNRSVADAEQPPNYTRDGTMSVIINYSDRKLLSESDRVAAPAPERAEAFATPFAYSGRYSIAGDKVTHHIEVASVQNWVNTNQIRLVKFDGDKITLTTPPRVLNGRKETFELVWQRVK